MFETLTPLHWLSLFTASTLALIVIFFLVHQWLKRTGLSEKEFSSPHGTLYYSLKGDQGPYVLMIHGLGSSSHCWRNISPVIAKNYRTLTIDLLGFGKSEKVTNLTIDLMVESLVSLLQDLKIKECHVVAHSMGCQIAVWLAARYPQKILKMVFISPAVHPKVVPRLFKRASWLALWSPLIVKPQLIRTILKRIVGPNTLITEDLVLAYHQPYTDPLAHLSFASAVEMLKDQRPYKTLHQIQKPVKILWGELDRVVHYKIISDIDKELPNSEVVTLPLASHLPLEDNPQWISEQILSFLKPV